MARRRFFVPPERVKGESATLAPAQSHHLRDVLRLRPGDSVELFDGEGRGYAGIVENDGPEIRVGSLTRIHDPLQPAATIVLATALLKSDKFDWVLQKATELGVWEVVPLTARRCDVRIRGSRVESRLDRWRRVVQDASRQCGRYHVPRVRAPIDFQEFLDARIFPGARRFLLHEKSRRRLQCERPVAGVQLLCIGPEGGWDETEVESAGAAGFATFGLGPRVLRAETAAVAAVAILQHEIAGEQDPLW